MKFEFTIQSMLGQTEFWQSELQFFKDESRFLTILIGNYFIHLMEKDNIEKMRKLAARLLKFDEEVENLIAKTNTHYNSIGLCMEKEGKISLKECRSQHLELLDLMEVVLINFKDIKSNIFYISEKFLHKQKLQHLLKKETT